MHPVPNTVPNADAEAVLSDLAGRHPHVRERRAVELARDLDAARRRTLLADLAGREPYCRHLAVTMAAATGERDLLAEALRDPHPSVRRHALSAPEMPDDALAGIVEDGALSDRLLLYAALRRGSRVALADRLLPLARRRWGDAEAARLLPACSGPVVAEALSTMAYGVANWRALAARHPDPVIGHVNAELAALDSAGRVDWWQRTGEIQRALARHRPDALLELCERFLTGRVLPVDLGRLLAVDPTRVARLILAEPGRALELGGWSPLTRSARARLAALPAADLGALLRGSGPAPRLVAAVLRAVPPSRRAEVFEAAYAGTDLATQILPDEVMVVLPHARRHAEARRMLALPAVATVPAKRLRVTALLSYPDAAPELERASRSAEAEERAFAYELLVRCAARSGDPAVLAGLLAGLGRIRNEQDPVRSRVLTALAEVRADLFAGADPDHLDRLVRDALDARDASWMTRMAIVRLVFRVLWHAVTAEATRPLMEWALETIERISAWQQAPMTVSLERELRRGQEHAVFERMRHRLTQALRRNNPAPLLALARSLDKRAWAMPELQELLGRATRLKSQGAITAAVSLWLAQPRGRDDRAAELVQHDESTITLPDVLAVVTRRRTDLVDRHVLAGKPLKGRFGTRKVAWVPTVDAAALRSWTPEQVRRYAKLLRRAVDDDGLGLWQRSFLARVLPGLPGRRPAKVADLIAGEEVLIAEAVLTGLAHCEPPDLAVPVLLEHLDGDRARVAVFSLSRCARHLAPSRLASFLRPALAEAPKVTVRKEAARLLASMRVPGAVDDLVAAWQRDGQHRDVLVAVAAALRGLLDDPRAWTVLEAAATQAERHAAESLLDADPYGLPESARERYAGLVRRLTGHAEPEVVRRAYRTLASWVPWAPGSGAEIAAGITDLAPGPTWRYAVGCATDPIVWARFPDLLADVTGTLVDLSRTDPDAEPLRDRPARQRLRALVHALAAGADAARRQPGPVRRMADVLGGDASFAVESAHLATALLWPGPTFADDLARLADRLADLPTAVSSLDGHVARPEWEPDDVAAGVDALTGRGDAAGGLLAVALTRVAGQRAGWPDDWRERLRRLRRHAAPDVRHAALAVIASEE
jgi:hypothetical protein